MSDIHNRQILQEHLRNIPSSAHVAVTIIPAGNVALPDYTVHANGTDEVITLPDYVFLIEHHGLGKKAFFDLGVAKDLTIYSPRANRLFKMFEPTPPTQGLAAVILQRKGISADQITQVIFSHVHWDHCHPFSSYLPNATALFGPSSIEGAKPGWPTASDSSYFSELVDPNHPWRKNVEELPGPNDNRWKPFGPFERAWDLWEDGSLWIIDAPGHVKGNIAAAARLKTGEWIVMGGDCAHSRQLLLGTKEIGVWKEKDGNELCMHGDRMTAKGTIRKLRELGEMEGVHIVLAHVPIDELEDETLKQLMI